MKSLIEKLFGRKEELNYVIGEYKPSYEQVLKNQSVKSALLDDLQEDKDEMAIDNLYQRN